MDDNESLAFFKQFDLLHYYEIFVTDIKFNNYPVSYHLS